MKTNFSDIANSSNYTAPEISGAELGRSVSQGNITEAVGKLNGYNSGFEEATATFNNIILVIFVSQLLQVFTHRFIYQEYPLKITFNDPFKKDKELFSWGSNYQPSDRTVNILKTIDGSLFAAGLTLAAYLALQVFGVPAYTYEVTTQFQ